MAQTGVLERFNCALLSRLTHSCNKSMMTVRVLYIYNHDHPYLGVKIIFIYFYLHFFLCQLEMIIAPYLVFEIGGISTFSSRLTTIFISSFVKWRGS